MVAKRQSKQEPAALSLVPENTPDDDAALQARADKAVNDLAELALGYIQKADAGDAAALAKLESLLGQSDLVALSLSGLEYHAQGAALAALNLDAQPGSKAVTAAQIQHKRRELLGTHPSPLERMLVDRLIMEWLYCILHDTQYARITCRGASLEAGEYWQKARERSHRQFMATVKTLATVRAAQVPAVAMIVTP